MEFRTMKASDVPVIQGHTISHGIIDPEPDILYEAFALEDDGHLLGAGGFRMIVPGTAWAWVDLTVYALARVKTCYRVISEWVDELARIHRIHRMQAYVDLEFKEAVRLVEHLGFTRESIMYDFLGDKPAGLYIKIYEVSQWER